MFALAIVLYYYVVVILYPLIILLPSTISLSLVPLILCGHDSAAKCLSMAKYEICLCDPALEINQSSQPGRYCYILSNSIPSISNYRFDQLMMFVHGRTRYRPSYERLHKGTAHHSVKHQSATLNVTKLQQKLACQNTLMK